MKYLLIMWALGGPHVEGVFHSRALCEAAIEHPLTKGRAAVRFCAEMDVDKIVSDMVLYQPSTTEK